ncbi:MAG: RNA polymerase sigma factor [Polyangiaceae bacterium]
MSPKDATVRARLELIPGGRSDPLDDEALIAGLQAGDQRVARELYRRLSPAVDVALFRVFGRREQDHDDLVQITFENVVRTLTRRRFAGACSLKTWASTIAVHVGLKALRSRRREQRVLDKSWEVEEGTVAGRANVEAEVSARADLARIRYLLTQINPRRAEVVFLRDVLGHDLAEIALILGSSVAATQSLLVRGRKDLAARWQEEGFS